MSNEEPKNPAGLNLLRTPVPDHLISKLPKETKKQIDERKASNSAGINCKVCGGWHHKNAVHLDYVGHAALTSRLLDADLNWNWEPLSFGPDGLPTFDKTGGLWIKLTVCGQTRLGYGHAESSTFKEVGSREKEVIGDALRNAAMRFGAALELWHKGDLTAPDQKPAQQPEQTPAHEFDRNENTITPKQAKDLWAAAQKKKVTAALLQKAISREYSVEKSSDLKVWMFNEMMAAFKDPKFEAKHLE